MQRAARRLNGQWQFDFLGLHRLAIINLVDPFHPRRRRRLVGFIELRHHALVGSLNQLFESSLFLLSC